MSEGDERSAWSWWERALFWGPFLFGIGLLVWGDGVDRAFAPGMVGIPAVCIGWATWKLVRERRAARRDRSPSS